MKKLYFKAITLIFIYLPLNANATITRQFINECVIASNNASMQMIRERNIEQSQKFKSFGINYDALGETIYGRQADPSLKESLSRIGRMSSSELGEIINTCIEKLPEVQALKNETMKKRAAQEKERREAEEIKREEFVARPKKPKTYCAVSASGGPPIGCDLTREQCMNIVRGLSGMSCI